MDHFAILVTKKRNPRKARWTDLTHHIRVRGKKDNLLYLRKELIANGVPPRAFSALHRCLEGKNTWEFGIEKAKLEREPLPPQFMGLNSIHWKLTQCLDEFTGDVNVMLLSQRPAKEWHEAVEVRLNQVLQQMRDLQELLEEHVDDEYKPSIRFTKVLEE